MLDNLTVEQVVNLLGQHFRSEPAANSRTVMAARYNVTYKAVSNWCSWGAFPQRLHLKIAQDCQAASITLPADFFDTQGNAGPARAAQ